MTWPIVYPRKENPYELKPCVSPVGHHWVPYEKARNKEWAKEKCKHCGQVFEYDLEIKK